MKKFIKDPEAVLDYTFEWADFLADGETITDADVFTDPEDALVLELLDVSATQAVAWVSGGANEARLTLTCRVTTTMGRTDDRSIYIAVLDQ